MKSHVAFVTALYGGIFSDATTWWPDIRCSVEKDLSYLRRASEQRGLGFYTLTLPAFGLWIDRSLDQGSFTTTIEIPRGIPLFRGRPRLFWGILSKVFGTDGMLRSEPDAHAVLVLRTLCQSLKKLELPVERKTLKKTLREFFDVEAHLPKSHPGTWDCEVPVWSELHGHPLWGVGHEASSEWPDLFGHCRNPRYDPPWDTLRQLCRRVVSELGEPDYDSLRPKHGPGAVSERGWNSKYEFPHWPRKLERVFPYDWFGAGDLGQRHIPADREMLSRLSAVPKTRKGPRLICAEPIAHQWMQQSIWQWLRKRITETTLGRSVDFSSQLKSQIAALKASRSGLYATLDLSAASDRVSTRLVEYVFQGSVLLDYMHACRTRAMKQSLDNQFPKLVLLRKFATMGSALTFPIQSIVFAILSVWALRLYEGREDDWVGWKADFDRVRVFGDDIIVPTHAYGMTKFVLHECGLRVNADKSYNGSYFRESCGMDAFDGVDVTPPRHTIPYSGNASTTAALIMYSNNLFSKGFWRTSDAVLGFIPEKERKLLVCNGPREGVLGLLSFCGSDYHLRTRRYDRDLQRDYIPRLGFTAKVKNQSGQGWSSLTQFFAEDPARSRDAHDGILLWNSGRATPSRLKKSQLRVYL